MTTNVHKAAAPRLGPAAPARLAPVVFALALVFALLPVDLRAATGTLPRFAIELDSGKVFVHEAGFGSGWKYGFGAFFRTGRRVATELMIESFAAPVEAHVDPALVAPGRMKMAALLVNEKLYALTRGRLLPYGLVGIGFTFLGFSSADWPEGTPRRVFVDRMALQLGGGLDVRLSSRVAVCAKVRYNLVKTWMEDEGRTDPIRNTDPLAQNMLHLYGLDLGFGFRIGF